MNVLNATESFSSQRMILTYVEFTTIRNKSLLALRPGSEDAGRGDGDAPGQPPRPLLFTALETPPVSPTGQGGQPQEPPRGAPQDSGPLPLAGAGVFTWAATSPPGPPAGAGSKRNPKPPQRVGPTCRESEWHPLHLRPRPGSPCHKLGPKSEEPTWAHSVRSGLPGPNAPHRPPAAPLTSGSSSLVSMRPNSLTK